MRFVIFSFTLLLTFVSSLYTFDQKGLVVYLKFDEGTGKVAKDSSGNKNDGSLQGNVTWIDGKHGKAAKVSDDNAGNMIVVKANPSLDITDQMTIGCWVNIESLPDSNCSLITKADTYMIHTSTWKNRGIEQELLLWPFDKWQTEASSAIQLKEWRHVLGVFDGKEIKMYIDGELKGKRAYGNKIAVTGNDLVIGRDSRACCNTRRSTQTYDDVVLFNRAVADNEVKEIMTGGGGMAVDPKGTLTILWGQVKAE